MANVLPTEKRLAVLAALVDGNSERAVERLTEVTRPTIGRFALTLGAGAERVHNRVARDLTCSTFEIDEIWSFVGKKQARVTEEENAAGLGEAYTFTALAMPSRFVASWKVGKRDDETADAFIADLRARLVVMPAMTSDGFPSYPGPIGKHMGPGVDYGQTIKNYRKGATKGPDHRYEPPREPFITKKAIFGAPDMKRATTAHIERNNGTMRHHIGRMRRLCYAFSKDPAHHRAAVSLCYCHYNLCWIPRTMRETPAMAAGATDHVWDLPELLDALLSAEPSEAPQKMPLAPRRPQGPARELPAGRGFLRLVPSGSGPSAPPQGPATPPAAPAEVLDAAASSGAPAAPTAPPVDDRQLDLFAWRPKPRPPGRVQLSLFGLDMDPDLT